MAWSRVGLYNEAMRCLGEGPLSGLSDNSEARRKLDDLYNSGDGIVAWAMEQGHWNFAMKAVKIDSDSAVDPQFGFNNAFSKPSDFRKLNMISGDETFSIPLTRYEDEGAYWWANVDPLYVRYVSDDSSYGGDFSLWTETFGRWLGAYMASRIAPGLKNEMDIDKLDKKVKRLLVEARSNDAMNEPARHPPLSSWAAARHGGRFSRRDRGSRNTLIG